MTLVVFRLGIDLTARITFIANHQSLCVGKQASSNGNVMFMGGNDGEAADNPLLISYSVELEAVKPAQATTTRSRFGHGSGAFPPYPFAADMPGRCRFVQDRSE